MEANETPGLDPKKISVKEEVKVIIFNDFIKMLQKEPSAKYDIKGYRIDVINNTLDHPDITDDQKREVLKNEILSVIQESKFIINDALILEAGQEKYTENLLREIAPPFQTCWIQAPDGMCLEMIDQNKMIRKVYAVFLHELEPHFYIFGIVAKTQNESEWRLQTGYINTLLEQHRNHYVWDVVIAFLQPFAQAYSMGTVKTGERVKFKINGEKVIHKIRRVIHIFPKSASARTQAENKYQIDWTHQWAVRGHWRVIKGIGKNRADEYCIKGFTWVVEHLKGPEDKPFIDKTRIITNDFFKKGEKL